MPRNALHCTENLIYVFLEMKLRGLVPNSYIYVSGSDLYFPWSAYLAAAKQTDQSWKYINCSQI
jgi:hypothetical protein